MISELLFLDFIKNKKNLLLKFLIPFIIVFISFQIGYGKITLVMLLIFTTITGSGLKIVKLKMSKMYDRLLISPLTKNRLFLEIAFITSVIYFVQFLPSLIVAALFEHIFIVIYSFMAILIIVFLGVLTGMHAKSLGEIHLYSIVFLIPLIALVMIPNDISYIVPFAAIYRSQYSLFTFLLSFSFYLLIFFIVFVDSKRL